MIRATPMATGATVPETCWIFLTLTYWCSNDRLPLSSRPQLYDCTPSTSETISMRPLTKRPAELANGQIHGVKYQD